MAVSGRSILKSSGGLMIATTVSRILGFVRVVYEASVLGGGALAGAWQMAFMIPNLFRRLFGEGAMGAAMVPIIAHELEKAGKYSTRQSLTLITAVTGIVLSAICIVISLAAMVAARFVVREDLLLICRVLPLVMPYAVFICLTGLLTSALGCVRVFFWPAVGALLLNIMEIAALVWWCPLYAGRDLETLEVLGYTVLMAGALQLLLMIGLLYSSGLGLVFTRSLLRRMSVVRELWVLLVPGLIGAAGVQLSTLADRGMAFSLGSSAVPALYNCDRLVFLPISVFALSLGGVIMPRMARAAARNNIGDLVETMFFGLRNLLLVCVPVAVFLIVFRLEILGLIFMHGRFGATALRETAWTMMFYAAGIPFFSCVKIVSGAFQARKNMKTPMKVSLLCVGLNIIMNLLLMFPLRQGGIALATVISSLLNNLILLAIMRRMDGGELPLAALVRMSLLTLSASVLLCAGLYWLYPYLPAPVLLPHAASRELLPLTICGSAFAVLYLAIMRLAGNPEAAGIFDLVLRRGNR